jgi:hypothetical protein
LALVLDRVLDEEDKLSELIAGRIVSIFYLFSQAENYVKEMVADRVVLKRKHPSQDEFNTADCFRCSKGSPAYDTCSSNNDVKVHQELVDAVDNTGQFTFSKCHRASDWFAELQHEEGSRPFPRQEDAAMNGIIPLLQRIMKTKRPPKEFALPIICDMAHSGKVGRKYLWQNKGLQFYVSLLEDQYWQVTALDAIFIWWEKLPL